MCVTVCEVGTADRVGSETERGGRYLFLSHTKGLSKSYRQGRVALAKIASGSAAAVEASSGNSRSARGVFYEFCIVEFGSSRPWGWKCQGNRKLQKPCFLNVKNRINQIPAVSKNCIKTKGEKEEDDFLAFEPPLFVGCPLGSGL